MAKKRQETAAVEVVYQFRITLRGVEPPIWRRVQVADGTLDQLHECIQAAMGWCNGHLHEFEIGGARYGDPTSLDDGFGDETDVEDSTRVRLSELLARRRKGFRFVYIYDLGDNWEHEIAFEGSVPAEAGERYPRCVEGARACPPEDCGGVWGYEHLLQVLSNPKHKEHDELKEWAGELDPEKFSAAGATERLHRGMPDWRVRR